MIRNQGSRMGHLTHTLLLNGFGIVWHAHYCGASFLTVPHGAPVRGPLTINKVEGKHIV